MSWTRARTRARTREQLKELKQLREQLASARAERTQFNKDVDEARAAASKLDLKATGLREKPEFLALKEALCNLGLNADRIADLEAELQRTRSAA